MKFRTVFVLLSLVLALLPLSAAAQGDAPPVEPVAPDAPAVTFTVNSTNDPGNGTCDAAECALREALIAANANGASKDTINFNIPGDTTHVITLSAALQAVTQPVIINGLSEPGAACDAWPFTLRIILNGSGLGGGTTGLKLTAPNVEVRGLVIQRFPSHGVEIDSNGNTLACNYIGTSSSGGGTNFGNGGMGVYINNGGANTLDRNLISGNGSFGVYIGGANATDNTLRGNRIGTVAGGASALANGEEGVILEGAANTKIGAGGGNVISGNTGHGVLINGASAGTALQGNRIGVSAGGGASVGNGGAGVYVNSTGVTVGGANAAEENVISGNGASGIVLDKTAVVRRNIIGLNAAATAKLPNGSYGIYARSSNNQISGGNVIAGNDQDGVFVESGENNKIQGNYIGVNGSLAANLGNGMFGVHVQFGQNTTIGPGNAIANNGADGVYLPNDASQGNRVTTNTIFGNGDLGIDLGQNGVTPNDNDDPDTGANGLQNFPALSAAGSDGSRTRIAGALNSKPNLTYRIEFFRTGGCDPSGYGEGRAVLGSADVTTNGSGDAAFNVILPVGVAAGQTVSATATDPSGNTSEFSQCRAALFENLPKPVYLPALFR